MRVIDSKFITLFCLSLPLYSQMVLSQDLNMGIKIGYGSYAMDDLKEIQSGVIPEVGIQGAGITESFPMFFDFSGSIGYALDYEKELKFELGFSSTGGRIAYSDFTGSYNYDQLARHVYFQSGVKFYLSEDSLQQNKIRSFIEINVGYSYSSVIFEQFLQIGDQTSSGNLDLIEHSFYSAPTFGVSIPLKSLVLEPYVGYYIDFIFRGLSLAENNEAKLQDSDGNLSASWRGLRTGVVIVFRF